MQLKMAYRVYRLVFVTALFAVLSKPRALAQAITGTDLKAIEDFCSQGNLSACLAQALNLVGTGKQRSASAIFREACKKGQRDSCYFEATYLLEQGKLEEANEYFLKSKVCSALVGKIEWLCELASTKKLDENRQTISKKREDAEALNNLKSFEAECRKRKLIACVQSNYAELRMKKISKPKFVQITEQLLAKAIDQCLKNIADSCVAATAAEGILADFQGRSPLVHKGFSWALKACRQNEMQGCHILESICFSNYKQNPCENPSQELRLFVLASAAEQCFNPKGNDGFSTSKSCMNFLTVNTNDSSKSENLKALKVICSLNVEDCINSLSDFLKSGNKLPAKAFFEEIPKSLSFEGLTDLYELSNFLVAIQEPDVANLV